LLLFHSDVKYKGHRVLLVIYNTIIAPTKDVLLVSRLPIGSILEERNLGRVFSTESE